MTYINQLRESKDKASVAFQEFALSTKSTPNHLFVFFEGKDNPYYIPRIKVFCKSIKPISCGGKQKVLKVHGLIKNQAVYDVYKKGFFVDNDFNNRLTPQVPPIYETSGYSIENFYMSSASFKEIMENEFHMSGVNDAFFDSCLDLYGLLLREFNIASTLFNAWYACLIEIRDATGVETGVQLEDRLPKGFIDVKLDGVTVNYDLDKIFETFPEANVIDPNNLQNKINEFTACNKIKTFRGKYEMQFLIKFIELILKDSNGDKTIVNRKINFSFGDASGLNNSQALSIFSSYAETEFQLNEYIKTILA